jgi:hypothetical protein
MTDEQLDQLSSDIADCLFGQGDRLSVFEADILKGSWNKEELTQAVRDVLQGSLQK